MRQLNSRNIIVLICIFFYNWFSILGFTNPSYTISGVVLDANSKEPLISCNIDDTLSKIFLNTDIDGKFECKLTENTLYRFSISYLGYNTKKITLTITKDTFLTIELVQQNILDEVVIQSKKLKKAAEINNTGVISISAKALNLMPEFLGEKDIIKALQLLPGVQSGNEGQRGIFVRGGSPDQNLLLYENAPVYNVAHLYNILSTFTTEAIEEASVHKNYYPANYTNRLSSITTITPSYGSLQTTKVHFGISPIFNNFNIQAPIKKDKISFNFNIRDCHIGLFSKPFSEKQFSKDNDGQSGMISYYFYDINFSSQYKIGKKHILKQSIFHSKDFYRQNFGFKDEYEGFSQEQVEKHYLGWHNIVNTIALESTLKNNFSTQSQFNISNYKVRYNYNETYSFDDFTSVHKSSYDYINLSQINDFSIQNNWEKKFKRLIDLKFGSQFNFRKFVVNDINEYYYDKTGTEYRHDIGKVSTHTLQENFIYTTIEQELHPTLNYYASIQGTWVKVPEKSFFYLLPKIQFVYEPNSIITLRVSYNRSMQPIHLLASTQKSINNDIWVPATYLKQPETGNQYSIGTQLNLAKKYTLSVEAFYRTMKHLIDYGTSYTYLLPIDYWENQVYGNGTGKSYGVEFFGNKTLGYFTFWTKYNLTWSKRQFNEINGGKSYFFKYDKRNDFNITLQYKLKKHFDFSLSWVYNSGMRITAPIERFAGTSTLAQYQFSNTTFTGTQNMEYVYGERNAYILPSYHHLDLGMNYSKSKKNIKHVFNISIYNIYNRLNIYSIYAINKKDEFNNNYTEYKKLSLFPILPSISYRLYFEKQ